MPDNLEKPVAGERFQRFLRLNEVEAATGFRTSSIYERVKAGKFPRPVKLDPKSRRSPVAWLESDIREWQAARIAERDQLMTRAANAAA